MELMNDNKDMIKFFEDKYCLHYPFIIDENTLYDEELLNNVYKPNKCINKLLCYRIFLISMNLWRCRT